jgi:hypothetical protein
MLNFLYSVEMTNASIGLSTACSFEKSIFIRIASLEEER